MQVDVRRQENDLADLQSQANNIVAVAPETNIDLAPCQARYEALCDKIQVACHCPLIVCRFPNIKRECKLFMYEGHSINRQLQ